MSQRSKPNILVIMTDQQSTHALGCYGSAIVRTPNIDRLAAEGRRFDNAYCPSPLCVPSRMSFLTSRYPYRNRVWANTHILSSGIPTWAHALGAAGYETALMGKMHFVGTDHTHGFEKRTLGNFIAKPPGTPEIGGPRWTKFPGGTSGQSRVSVDTVGTGTTTYQWFDQQVAAAAVRYIRSQAACDVSTDRGSGLPAGVDAGSKLGSKPDAGPLSPAGPSSAERPRGCGERDARARRPFAAVVGFNLPHCPFVAPADLFAYYLDRMDVPAFEAEAPASVQRYRARRGIETPPVPPLQVRRVRAAYFALVEYVDSLIGEVLSTLEECGLAENTVVVYCADHGEMAGEHGCFWKSTYYEASAAVPLILRCPVGVDLGVSTAPQPESAGPDADAAYHAAGTAEQAVVNLVDIGPTLCELAGADLPGVDGRSLLPALSGAPLEGRTETFSELYDEKGGVPILSRMIRSGRWKMWKDFDDADLPPVLFDLDSDPGESTELAEDPDYAEVRNQLLEKLTDGWDPRSIEREAAEASESYRTIAAWGRTTQPRIPETLTVPGPELEADVEILPPATTDPPQ